MSISKAMNTIFPTKDKASNTPSATAGPSVHVLADGRTERNSKHSHIVQ